MKIDKTETICVIIPAWKADYLSQAIDSILAQRSDNFELYVFDDAAPDSVRNICKDYFFHPKFHYHRFDDNIGGHNLVQHWHRCIDLVNSYKWIWLFSDDDIASECCISSFNDALHCNPNSTLFRFPLSCIDEKANILYSVESPPSEDSTSYLTSRLRNFSSNFVVEYIFSKEQFDRVGGFPEFDLAWGSDVGLWAKFLQFHPAIQLSLGTVYWRKSDSNISPNMTIPIVLRKLQAQLDFIHWLQTDQIFETSIKIISNDITYYFNACIRNSLSYINHHQAYKIVMNHATRNSLVHLPPFAFKTKLLILWAVKKITRILKFTEKASLK